MSGVFFFSPWPFTSEFSLAWPPVAQFPYQVSCMQASFVLFPVLVAGFRKFALTNSKRAWKSFCFTLALTLKRYFMEFIIILRMILISLSFTLSSVYTTRLASKYLMLLQKQKTMDYSTSDIREQNYGIHLMKNWNFYHSIS